MRDAEIVTKCKMYIRSNLNRTLTIAMIAREVNYNQDYIIHVFKKVMGITLMKYIREEKMELATMYLLEGRSVIEVAELLGYSKNGFTKAYRAVKGVNPSSVYKQSKKERTVWQEIVC